MATQGACHAHRVKHTVRDEPVAPRQYGVIKEGVKGDSGSVSRIKLGNEGGEVWAVNHIGRLHILFDRATNGFPSGVKDIAWGRYLP